MTSPVRCLGLSKRFPGVLAIGRLDLDVPDARLYALIGPKGAGKTTKLKQIMNLLRPSAGQAMVLGVDSRRLGSNEFTRIGYVSENQKLPEWMTVDYFRCSYPTVTFWARRAFRSLA